MLIGKSPEKSRIQWDSLKSLKLIEVGNLANGAIGISQESGGRGDILVKSSLANGAIGISQKSRGDILVKSMRYCNGVMESVGSVVSNNSRLGMGKVLSQERAGGGHSPNSLEDRGVRRGNRGLFGTTFADLSDFRGSDWGGDRNGWGTGLTYKSSSLIQCFIDTVKPRERRCNFLPSYVRTPKFQPSTNLSINHNAP